MPLRVGKLKRSALTHFAKRMTAGEQLKPRFDRLLLENGKLLRELVRELQRVDDNRQQSGLCDKTTGELLGETSEFVLWRENVSCDDPILAARADRLVAEANSQDFLQEHE